ncbi:GNAT family N-acetyltransferase [Kitasatospora aureofaciens]|uniref:GNAT family N-acetyltransferase n=1 Tax=Kitasatospora aureofaciens TaxID=1894 RepID=A0A1E7MZD2_KITAU|nr:GNAT family N-acetyltransferase [Kitasatospora aureofaciens]QEU99627.1 GNAT family N-acetyltransferase [Streptomyces viridifaciens]ARF78415.1 GNAT family N-acetyltransferase [Kitasatospora aureofaciens]OEV33787.1 GNAT family N-acetyltransferase [Kitasatospora aureofaciens]UKZ05733.1 GNAT family N-acetyltransferase [Streptomyces viridifaciens]GGU79369.1 GNAT family acetyltransferase [Kitasatospora aureofaciens]
MTETAVLTIRRATEADLPAIVGLLADDPLGATRETLDDLTPYRTAFARIDGDPHQHLVVAERAGRTVGTLQLTLVPGLSRTGSTRAIIEAVRVRADDRGSGLGTELIRWAVERARELGADLVQLTSDATRTDAHRFYERLGFAPSHLGFKMTLPN